MPNAEQLLPESIHRHASGQRVFPETNHLAKSMRDLSTIARGQRRQKGGRVAFDLFTGFVVSSTDQDMCAGRGSGTSPS